MKIKWIIDGYRYWDKTNGNSYYLTRITHVNTGNSLVLDQSEGNARSILNRIETSRTKGYLGVPCVHVSPIQDIPRKEWRWMRNSEYHAPVDVYERKGKRIINNTDKLVRGLRRASC